MAGIPFCRSTGSIVAAALAIASCLSGVARAQVPTQAASSAPARPCVLLANDNVLFGRAYQLGEFVIVQTGNGGELKLTRSEVTCWASSLRDLYRYRVDHRTTNDVVAHLRDARWCVQHDLLDLAADEIQAIKRIDPDNLELKLIEGQLSRMTAPASSRSNRRSVPLGGSQPTADETGSHEMSDVDLGVDLSMLRFFASHVQPMLINRCGRCHAHDSQLSWRLVMPPSGARASARMTRENLAASLRFVDRNSPAQSEILVKATAAHGGTSAPLDPRSAKALEAFRTWLDATKSRSAGTSVNPVAPSVNAIAPIPAPAPRIAERPAADSRQEPNRSAGDQPRRLPQVQNPFDPSLFNRRFHPDGHAGQ